MARFWKASTVLLLCSSCVYAAPKLRLTNTVVGPVTVAQGQAGPQQQLEIYNAGDGVLNPQFLATANWVQATTATRRPCLQREGECIPVNIALNTQAVATGLHTATVTVHDQAALDAPQNILVSVRVGSGVPERLDFLVAPGGSDEAVFHMNRCSGSVFGAVCMGVTANTGSGGNWLSVALDGLGSFRFALPFRVEAKHLQGMAEGTYQGTVNVSDSQFAADNRSVNVTMRVTTQPIARAGASDLRFRIAQNTRRQTQNVKITNGGQGSLTIADAAATVTSGGNWLTAERVAGVDQIAVSADVTGLNPGVYQGSAAVNTNGVNSPLNVPVVLEVVAQGPPVTSFMGVVNNANFSADDELARGVIAAAFGEQLTFGEATGASSLPLGTQLGDIQVFLNDRPVPLYYASYGQVNFQVPYDAQLGPGTLRVDRGSQRGNSVSIAVVNSLPRLLRLSGNYALAVNESQGRSFPVPESLGIPNSRPARAGDVLVIYALGLGPTNPPVPTGAGAAASEPLARVPSPGGPRVFFGALALPTGVPAEPQYVGLTPNLVGLYQINVVVPPGVTPGDVPIRLQLDTVTSDFALIAVQ